MLPFDIELDTSGLSCPMPLLKTKKALNGMRTGQVLRIISTDTNALYDFPAFARQTGHELLHQQQTGNHCYFWIRKSV